MADRNRPGNQGGTLQKDVSNGAGTSFADTLCFVDTLGNVVNYMQIADGVTNTLKATVAQFHNSDGQALGAGYALAVGGIGQVLNLAGTLDRVRETGVDNVPAVGLPTDAPMVAGASFNTTFNGAVTGSATAQSVVVASSAAFLVGDVALTQDNAEYVLITAIADGTHVTGIFKNNHANGQTLTAFHFNMLRDATTGDNIAGTGIEASAMYAQSGTTTFSRVRQGTQFVNLPATAVTANTPVTIYTAGASKKWRIMGYNVSSSVAGAVIFKEATVERLRTPLMAAGVGIASGPMGNGFLGTTNASTLQIDVTATGTVSGWVLLTADE